MGKKSALGTRAKELCDQFPGAATKTLAEMLYKEAPEAFSSVETARARIRYYRGQIGNRNRKDAGVRVAEKPERGAPPPSLPEPKREFSDWGAVQLRARRILVLSDIHVPYFDKPALEAAIKFGQDNGVDAVLFNGDLMDFYSVSRHLKDPRERDFSGEIEMGKEVLQYFRETFKGAQIWWKIGNHEERWEHWMWNKAPEICGVMAFDIEEFMEVDRWNIKVVRDMRPVKVNRLNILHGHEYKFAISNPVNPARGLYLRAKVPAMMGHLHQTSEHTEGDLNSKIVTCWSTGCLCDLRPQYSPLNKWNHGFALVDTTGEDDFTVHNKRIYQGRVL